MDVVSVCQNKGGTGKTTVSRLLAEGFARAGKRTLLIDFDPQCNVSQRYLVMRLDPMSADGIAPPIHPEYDPEEDADWSGVSSSASIFVGSEGATPYSTAIENLWILPGDGEQLRRIELVTLDDVKAQVHDRLATWMALDDVKSTFDVVVLDTAPSKGPLAVAAMRSATHILMPSEMETQSVEGLRGMLALWRTENRARAEKIKIIGILPNKFRKQTNLQAGIFQGLRDDVTLGPLMAPCSLGLRSSFAEADHPDAVPKSIFSLPVSSEARQEAEAVMEWVEARMRK